MYTDGNPCEFFFFSFFGQNMSRLTHGTSPQSTPQYFCSVTAVRVPILEMWMEIYDISPEELEISGICPTFQPSILDMQNHEKKTNLVQDSQDKLQGIYTFDIHGFAPPIPIFSHHFPVFSPLHRNHFLVHPIFERPTSSHHLTRLQRKPQTGISRWGNDGQLYPPLKLPQPQYKWYIYIMILQIRSISK